MPVVAAFFAAANAMPCCAVAPSEAHVVFGGQTNIIVWDEVRKVEHFVRIASFQSDAKDFGFIAPTPGVPDLAEADDAAFGTLAALEPRRRELTKEATGGMDSAASLGDGPEVIQEIDVAGYRATTLKAEDAAGLAKWMKGNGYSTSPEIEDWTKLYIAKGWYLTTFKVLGGRDPKTGCVRMSFKTDRPFNPYYVPRSNAPIGQRRAGLQLYFVSNAMYSPDANLGSPKWSARVPEQSRLDLARQLRLPSLPKNLKVLSFHDAKFPRTDAGEDVFFNPSPLNPERGSTSTILAFVLGAGIAGYGLWRRKATNGPKPR